MHSPDIRWRQRLSNYRKALAQLEAAVDLARSRPLSQLEKAGLVQSFEMVFELAWNVMKDYLVWQGTADITGSRDAIRHAFKVGLVADGEGWMEMIKSRNQTAHTYNEAVADQILQRVSEHYRPLFAAFESHMTTLQPSA